MQNKNITSLRAAVLRGEAIPAVIREIASERAHRPAFGAGKNARSTSRSDVKDFAYTL